MGLQMNHAYNYQSSTTNNKPNCKYHILELPNERCRKLGIRTRFLEREGKKGEGGKSSQRLMQMTSIPHLFYNKTELKPIFSISDNTVLNYCGFEPAISWLHINLNIHSWNLEFGHSWNLEFGNALIPYQQIWGHNFLRQTQRWDQKDSEEKKKLRLRIGGYTVTVIGLLSSRQ